MVGITGVFPALATPEPLPVLSLLYSTTSEFTRQCIVVEFVCGGRGIQDACPWACLAWVLSPTRWVLDTGPVLGGR